MAPVRSASLAIIASLLAVSLRAQQDTTPAHAAPLLTGNRSVTELGAGVTLLDVDSLLRESPVHTLSELLTGRVPGLEVLASSGTFGTGSRLLMRGASSFLSTSAPQIYVDGIRADDDPATLLRPGGDGVVRDGRRQRRAAHHDEARSPRSVAGAGIFVARGGRTAARFSRQLPRGGLVRSALPGGRRGQRTVPLVQRQRARRSRLISVPPWIPAAVRRERVGREHLAAILGRGSMGWIRRRIWAARRRASPARNHGWSAGRRAEPQLS